MSTDKNNTGKIISKINLKEFILSLENNQKRDLSSIILSSDPEKLRKNVYLSSGGNFFKYADFMIEFAYKSGFVPIHPIVTLDYFLSTTFHNHKKSEIIKDCFSLLSSCEELWVFDEKLPLFNDEEPDFQHKKPISQFSEGVLAEIYFWLTNKQNFPIRFFTWKDIGIAKYDDGSKWSLIPDKREMTIMNAKICPKKFGIVDLGSSTVKLSVFSMDSEKQVEILHKKAITVNLAEGFFNNEELQTPAMERTIEAVLDCQKEALSFGVLNIKIIGTGILRKAKNIGRFSSEIKNKTGFNLEVLSSKEEAGLIYKAVSISFSNKESELIVVNAGGGTSEIVFGKGEKVISYFSLPLGISNLNEKFVSKYPIPDSSYGEMKKYIELLLKENIDIKTSSPHLIYTGGELDYMIITGFPLEDFSLSLSHPKKISLQNLRKYSEKMRKMSQDEIYAFMPSNPRWMGGAISSNTILETITEFFDVKEIIPSNKNLNDGILLTMIE